MERNKGANISTKKQSKLNIFIQAIGYLTVATVMVLSIIFWVSGNIANIAQTSLIGAFVAPVIGIVVFLAGLVSRWNHGTSKHMEIVGIATIFVWIIPTVIFFIMK